MFFLFSNSPNDVELIPKILEFASAENSFNILLDLDWGSVKVDHFAANINEMKDTHYKTIQELVVDAKWMLHTWIINYQKKNESVIINGQTY